MNKACQVTFKYALPIILALSSWIYTVCFEIFFDHCRVVMENLFVISQILSFYRVGYRHG